MSTTVTYEGSTIATVNNNTKTLQTAGKYLTNDITLVDVSQSGSAATLITKNITSNGTYDASNDNADGYSSVTVNVPQSGITPTGTKQVSITQNGTTTEDVTNYASVEINASVVNADYTSALTALGVQSDLADSIAALTTYSNSVTGESDTTLSDAVASLASGYGGGGVSISDGCVITARNEDDFPTAVDHYGTKVHKHQYRNRIPSDGAWKSLESITFKNTVTEFEQYAFSCCSKITSLDVSSVTRLGQNALQDCTGLTALTLPVLTTLNTSALIGCTGLTSLVLPLCKSYPGTAIRKCTGLQTVQMGSIGNAVTGVSSSAFQYNTQSGLTITVYTTGTNVGTLLTNIRSGAANATVIFKASADTTYNGNSYSAGDTMLTSTPS